MIKILIAELWKTNFKDTTAAIVVASLSMFAVLIGLVLWGTSALFEYSLWCITGRDVPWYADLVGGCVLNGVNDGLAIMCWIAQLAGYSTPFLGG